VRAHERGQLAGGVELGGEVQFGVGGDVLDEQAGLGEHVEGGGDGAVVAAQRCRIDDIAEQAVGRRSGRPVRKTAYACVSCLNRWHMKWAWISLIWVGFSDLYVRMCAVGIWTDVRLF